MPFAFVNTGFQNGFYVFESGAVKQDFGWFLRCVTQVDLDAVALAGPDFLSVGAECKTLFIIGLYDFLKDFQVEGQYIARGELLYVFEQVGYGDPALFVRLEAEKIGLVPEDF